MAGPDRSRNGRTLAIAFDFLSLLLASLLAGTMFGVRPNGLDGAHYVELQ
jgi:hypothetical protein